MTDRQVFEDATDASMVPTNHVGSGGVEGIGVGPNGEPPGKRKSGWKSRGKGQKPLMDIIQRDGLKALNRSLGLDPAHKRVGNAVSRRPTIKRSTIV